MFVPPTQENPSFFFFLSHFFLHASLLAGGDFILAVIATAASVGFRNPPGPAVVSKLDGSGASCYPIKVHPPLLWSWQRHLPEGIPHEKCKAPGKKASAKLLSTFSFLLSFMKIHKITTTPKSNSFPTPVF